MRPAPLDVVTLGHRPYREVLELQRALRLARLDGALRHDTLLLVEHDPVYTLGRGTRDASLPIPVTQLRGRGADVIEIERGGDVTWHGPGQLVGYPIFHLSRHHEDLHWYLRTLEQALIAALGGLGIPARAVAGKTGVWTRDRKIASIGIHVKQWVTLHGFALNVHPDLSWFDWIVPCGLDGVVMTSVAHESAATATDAEHWRATSEAIIPAMGEAFGLSPRSLAEQDLPAVPA